MIIAAFLALLAATLAFGGWLGARWTHVSYQHDAILAEHQRGWDINDAVDMSETARDWGGEL